MPRIVAFLLTVAVAGTLQAQITADSGRLVNYETLYLLVNVKQPPFDDVDVRYALAMATDREAITRLFRNDQQTYTAGRGFVPPYAGYAPVDRLMVTVAGEQLDVLSYDPAAARRLLLAGRPKAQSASALRVEILAYDDEETVTLTRALAEMWTKNLGAQVVVRLKPWHDYLQAVDRLDFAGVALQGRSTLRSQPDSFLFSAMFELEKFGWTDREIMTTLDHIGSEPSYFKAAAKLRRTEERLLRSMPVIPLFSRTP